MIKYLFILLLIGSSVFGATYEGTFTICDTCNHTTLALAETAHEQDLVTNDSSLTFQIKEGSSAWADQSATSIDGYTTNSTHTITVTTVGNARHAGVWDGTTAYRLSGTYRPLYVGDDYVTIDGLQSTLTGSTDYRYVIEDAGTEVTIKNCISYNQSTATTGIVGMRLGTGTSYCFNNIIYNAPEGVTMAGDDAGVKVYNNTIVDCDTVFYSSYLDGVFRNNLCYNFSAYMDGDVNHNTPSNYNAFDTSSVSYPNCTACGANDVPSIADPFVDYANDTFLVASKWQAVCDRGRYAKDIIADTTDIEGDIRPQGLSWDIGADEFAFTMPTNIIADGESDVDDGYTDGNSVSTPRGGETWIYNMCGFSSCTYYALFKFDLTGVSGNIDSTVFKIRRHTPNTAYTVRFYRITTDWTESEFTWDSAKVDPGGVAWTTGGGDYNATIIDSFTYEGTDHNDCNLYCERGDDGTGLTQLVQDWIDGTYSNYGILLKTEVLALGDTLYYYSSENFDENQSPRPKLYIEYTASAGGTTVGRRRKIILE